MRYAQPHQFEPFLPRKRQEELFALAQSVTEASLILRGALHPSTAAPLGPVRFGLPLDALQFYFPDLYPEAATRPDED